MFWVSRWACAEGTSELLHSQGRWDEIHTCNGEAELLLNLALVPAEDVFGTQDHPCPTLSSPSFHLWKSFFGLGRWRKLFLLFPSFGNGNTRLQSSLWSLRLGMLQKSVPPSASSAGGGQSPGLPREGLALGGQGQRIKPGCRCGPFCRRWQNEWASVLLNHWWAGRYILQALSTSICFQPPLTYSPGCLRSRPQELPILRSHALFVPGDCQPLIH